MVTNATPRQKRQVKTVAQTKESRELDLALKSWLSVVRAYNLCDALMAKRLAPMGLRTSEHEILANLLREPGLTQQALAQRCFTAKSHISALLSQMETNSWLTRENHPQDARAKCLHLLPQGKSLAQRSLKVQSDVVRLMANALNAEQLEQVRTAMLPVQVALEQALNAS